MLPNQFHVVVVVVIIISVGNVILYLLSQQFQFVQLLLYMILKDLLGILLDMGLGVSFPRKGWLGCSRRRWILESVEYGIHDRFGNHAVFEMLKTAVLDFKGPTLQLKGFLPTKDGRGAWLAFFNHYMGQARLESLVSGAENKVENSVYTGDKPWYNFETHVNVHQKAHYDIVRAGELEGDGPIDQDSFLKVVRAEARERGRLLELSLLSSACCASTTNLAFLFLSPVLVFLLVQSCVHRRAGFILALTVSHQTSQGLKTRLKTQDD